MGNINNYLYNPIKCAYCSATVTERTSICLVHSKGKLNGLYVCNMCLLNKSRRYDYLAQSTYNNKYKKVLDIL
jgi:hypothetical protein